MTTPNSKALIFLLTVTSFLTGPAWAEGTTRTDEINTCLPGELQTWDDHQDVRPSHSVFAFDYRHSPRSIFSEKEVTERIERSLQAWRECGLSLSLRQPSLSSPAPTSHKIQIDWDAQAARIGIAVADLNRRRLSLNPTVFELLIERRDHRIALETLQMTLSHEIGHFFGMLAHSRRCVDVMSYYDDGKGAQCMIRDRAEFRKVPEYRSSLPTACDIKRCQILQQTKEK